MIAPVPLRTYDLYKDAHFPCRLPTWLHRKSETVDTSSQRKKPIRNLNFMKMVMNKSNKKSRLNTSFDRPCSKTIRVETEAKTCTSFNPQIPRENNFMASPRPATIANHRRNLSQQIQPQPYNSSSNQLVKAFPQRKVRKSRDAKWLSYCTNMVNQKEIYQIRKYHQSMHHHEENKGHQIQTLNVDQGNQKQLTKEMCYKTIQYSCPRGMRRSGKKMRSEKGVSGEISPWATSVEHLQLHEVGE